MRREHRSLFLIAVVGNLLCWVGDALLCVFPGHETVSGFTFSPAWANALLWRFSLSALCGGVAMMGVLCGFYALYQLLRPTAPISAKIVMIGGLLGCVPGAVMHMQCTSAAWIYARMGGTDEAMEIAEDYFMQHMPLFILCTVGLLMACLELLRCVVLGKSSLPRWAAVFNIIILSAALNLLRPLVIVPGTMNLGGAGMFAGLYFCTAEKEGGTSR